MLNSTNTPNPIGTPNLSASFVVSLLGPENFENNLVGLYSFFLRITNIKTNKPIIIFIEVAIPQPTPPIGGTPKYPYTKIISRGIFSNIPINATQNTGRVKPMPSL